MKKLQLLILLGVSLSVALTAYAVDPTAFVINATAETLSRINLQTGHVDNDILPLGSDVFCYPNQIVIGDSLAYVVNSGTNEIQIININTVTTRGFIPTGSGTNPYWMACLDSRYAYVSNLLTDEVIKVDLSIRTVIDHIPVGPAPEGVLIHDARVWVAVTGYDFGSWSFGDGRVVVIDTDADTVLARITVGTNPQYLTVDPRGRIHVVCTGDYFSIFGQVYIIDPAQLAVIDSLPVGGSPGNLTIAPDGIAYIAAGGWVHDGYVFTYDALDDVLLHGSANPIVVDSGCQMAVAFQDTTCFVGGFKDFVKPVDSSGQVQASYAVGDGPQHIAFNYVPGDANGDFSVNIVDLTQVAGWFFLGGAAPPWPQWRANVNGDRAYNIIDLTYLVRYLFDGGPAPEVGPTWM